MMTYEQDPDVVQWGLRFFECDPYSDCGGYCNTTVQEDAACYQGHYVEEDHYGIQCNDIDNDELLAHALQEELSQLAVTETKTPRSPDEQSGQLQQSIFSQDWQGHPVGSYGSGQEESEDVTHSSSCSSPEENSYCVEDWPYSLELADEYAYDGEVGKRLNQMVPVPHVPRINGEIPSMDEATLDHQRLLERLQLFGLVEHKVQGDGNCQFRALSDQIYRIPEHHEFVRQQIVNQLKSHREVYEGYVPMGYDEYLEKMSMNGEWGDHVTLQAAADLYGVKIFVITSFKDTCYIEILPSDQRSKRVIHLSFWAEVHYNSIYLEGDVPTFKSKKKKKWRMFRNKQMGSIDDY